MAVAQTAVSGVLYTDQADWYPDPNFVARLHPASTPFLSELMAKPAAETPYVDYKMFQKEAIWIAQYFDINNGAGEAWDSGGTPTDTNTVTVDGATGLTIDDSIKGLTFEVWSSDSTTYRGLVRVQSVTNTTTVVLEAVGNASSTTEAIANLSNNDRLFATAYAGGEVGESPDADSQDPDVIWNSLQHHRTALEISYDLANSALRGVENATSKLQEIQTDKMDQHKIQLDYMLWRGYRIDGIGGADSGAAYGADSTGGTTDSFAATHIPNTTEGRVRTTMGYIPAVLRYGRRLDSDSEQSYFSRVSDTYSFNMFVEDTEKIFQFDDDPDMPGMRKAFCGPGAYSHWTKFAVENSGAGIQIGKTEEGAFGYHFRRMETPNGVLDLVRVPSWKGRYTNYCAIPTMRWLGLRRLTNSGPGTEDPGLMGYFPDIKKDNRPLKRKDEYHSHIGLEMRQLKAQALMIFA